jgi:hypothetical protein
MPISSKDRMESASHMHRFGLIVSLQKKKNFELASISEIRGSSQNYFHVLIKGIASVVR